jgi:DNA-binding NtrC family response regulator
MTAARIGSSVDSGDNRRPHILVVDDEETICTTLARFLPICGYRVQIATNSQEALKLRDENAFDVLLPDFRHPDKDGIELARRFKAGDPEIVVILMTAYGTIENAVEAMRAGADDYLVKPFRPLDEVHRRLTLALEHRRLARENAVLRKENQTLRGQVR